MNLYKQKLLKKDSTHNKIIKTSIKIKIKNLKKN